tara:strand:+ start:201 stop:806 length:606 start_codon:yes stop_codon:yes gene_type:complete
VIFLKIFNMKKVFTVLLFLSLFSLLSALTYKTIRVFTPTVVEITPEPITVIKVEPTKVEIKKIKGYNDFLDAIGHQESGNRYDIVNRYGYMGRYQFGSATLKTLKIKVTREAFLNSPDLQEYAMKQLLLYNKKKLQKYIDEFDGQIVHGILVTESGLLAAAHLGGQGSVKKWFRTGKIRKDGNGVKITSYMKRFSGYKLYL